MIYCADSFSISKISLHDKIVIKNLKKSEDEKHIKFSHEFQSKRLFLGVEL